MSKGFAPSAERNKDVILEVLRRVLPEAGVVLEIASGTGQHADYFSESLPHLHWQPTDMDADALASIRAHVAEAERENLLAPLALDVSADFWGAETWGIVADAILCINMIHISPWESSIGLFRGASEVLDASQRLVTYGPYRVDGEHTAPSNIQFEAWLKGKDARFGVRDIGELEDVAREHALVLEERVPMPANNFILVWSKA